MILNLIDWFTRKIINDKGALSNIAWYQTITGTLTLASIKVVYDVLTFVSYMNHFICQYCSHYAIAIGAVCLFVERYILISDVRKGANDQTQPSIIC